MSLHIALLVDDSGSEPNNGDESEYIDEHNGL